jgi:transcriptional antiterminator Rof (Rho-off)
MPDSYQPVSCQLHSEIELHATRGSLVNLKTDTPDSTVTGRIIDITIHDKAEYVVVETENRQTIEIRLDHIQTITLT